MSIAVVSLPPLPSVVSLPSGVSPKKPQATGTDPFMRSASSSTRVDVSTSSTPPISSVITGQPSSPGSRKKESTPSSSSAVLNILTEVRSPMLTISSASSRSGSATFSISSISLSVVFPIAETTTQTSSPSSTRSATLSAARLTLSPELTLVPPNFTTILDI